MANYRVVITDSHPFLLGMLEDQLTRLGHTTVGRAGSCVRALALVASLKPDLLILDLSLYDLDEMAPLKALAEQEWPVPVLVFSYSDEPAIIDQALAAGASAHIGRPMGIKHLATCIEQVVDGWTKAHGHASAL